MSNLNSPLAYSPSFLGAKNQELDTLVVLDGMLKDPKVWQLNATLNGSTLTITYKGMVENLYKEKQWVKPNGVLSSYPKVYQVFCALSSIPKGINQKPDYQLKIWEVGDAEGDCNAEEYEVSLRGLLEVLYPQVETFKINFKRYLDQDFTVVL